MPSSAQDVRAKLKHFRILVVGRANAGKTPFFGKSTIPQKSPRSSMVNGIRATSDPSQSRRRGPHPAEHENIKAEVVPPASTLPPRMHSTTGA
ncbi:hypothetical protein M405DRAFT_835892 [Rhizopogon salebrosus TDB-379]|nr:hypothetical protein M405DRAFT_835892 [Rhizopogon salebrosus TDB-379]